VESCCELGNEPSGSIKYWETTEWLHNLWPLEWYSVPQSVSYVIVVDYHLRLLTCLFGLVSAFLCVCPSTFL
jgi:hypothetical protein